MDRRSALEARKRSSWGNDNRGLAKKWKPWQELVNLSPGTMRMVKPRRLPHELVYEPASASGRLKRTAAPPPAWFSAQISPP